MVKSSSASFVAIRTSACEPPYSEFHCLPFLALPLNFSHSLRKSFKALSYRPFAIKLYKAEIMFHSIANDLLKGLAQLLSASEASGRRCISAASELDKIAEVAGEDAGIYTREAQKDVAVFR